MSIINVTTYDIPADGVTDAGPAVTAMLRDAAPYSVIEFDPSVELVISRFIGINKPLTIRGARIKLAGSSSGLYITSSDVNVQDVYITGPGADVFDGNVALIYALGTSDAPLERLRFTRCRLQESSSSCLKVVNARDIQVVDVQAKRFAYMGFQFTSVNGAVISRCIISECTGLLSNSYGISFSDTANTELSRSQNALIFGCRVSDIKTWAGIDTHSGRNIRVIGNHVENCAAGIDFVVGDNTRITPPSYAMAIGNFVDFGTATTQRYGLRIAGKDGAAPASGILEANTVVGYTTPVATERVNAAKTWVGHHII